MSFALKCVGMISVFSAMMLVGLIVVLVDFSNAEDIDDFIAAKMKALEAKGLAVAFIEDDRITWSRNYGYADLEPGTPVADDTIFQIASVSKLVTGVAIMQLREQGLIDLDASINEYLPFEIANPNFPTSKITARMLMQHKSSLIDNEEAYRSTFTIFRGSQDPDMSLEALVRNYYLEGGMLYDPEANFSKTPPGEARDYSNIAFGLLGFIAERVTGVAFNDYCAEKIFAPLQMTSTGWFTFEIDVGALAVPYDGENRLKPYGVASYPDGAHRKNKLPFRGSRR